jgi:hypothetical protein
MKVKFLTNIDLIDRLGKLVRTERKITHLILECIAEIDARKLYLEKAYPSLYEFLVKEFGYSPSAAIRRIEGARLLREVPELSLKIESGQVNLSQLSKVQQAIRTVQKTEDRKVGTKEKREILLKIENTTQAQTEQILAQEFSLPAVAFEKRTIHNDGSVTLSITFSKEQIALLEKVQDLVSHQVPEKKWAEVISLLAQKEVDRKTKILRASKVAKIEAMAELTTESNSELNSELESESVTRADKAASGQSFLRKAIRPNLRKAVFNQHQGCGYTDPATGKVCASTRFSQIDHRHSVWAGGQNGQENLQVLCAQHNRLKYQKEAGLHPLRRYFTSTSPGPQDSKNVSVYLIKRPFPWRVSHFRFSQVVR